MPDTAKKRRSSMSPAAMAIRILLVRLDPVFHRGVEQGLEQMRAGSSGMTYDDFMARLGRITRNA